MSFCSLRSLTPKAYSIALFLSLLLVATASVAQEFVTDGLAAFYTLDESDIDGVTVKDVSGNAHDAKIVGTLKLVKGVIDECLAFDGEPNYVEIPPMGSWEQASIECWALTLSFDGTPRGLVSTWQWVAGKVHFKFQSNQKITAHKNDGAEVGDKANFELNTWYHIIYTCDTAANELKLYVNGELVNQGVSGATPQNMDERRIGSEHDGRFLNGMVDDVRIYNRILNETEVKQNFKVKSNLMAVSLKDKLATCWGQLKERE